MLLAVSESSKLSQGHDMTWELQKLTCVQKDTD